MRIIFYDQHQAADMRIVKHKSWLRVAAYILLFISGIMAGMAIAAVMV